MKNHHILILTALMLISLTSCKKFVEIAPPKNQVTNEKVFADSASANSAVIGIYVNMYQTVGLTFGSGGLTLNPGLSADELAQSASDDNVAQIFSNRISPNNTNNSSLWSNAYKYIYDVNACIEGLNASTQLSPTFKMKFIAEARQLRAFLYFNLVNLYGPVPLQRTTDYQVNRSTGRASTDSIYVQVISDAKFAQANLPVNTTAERANYYAATALLAKAELYLKNYVEAEKEATKIITSGSFTLEQDLSNVFLATSKEIIWKMVPFVPGYATWEGYYFVPATASAVPRYPMTNSLYTSFETGDQRKTKWINVKTVKGVTYPYPYKYKVGRTTTAITENYAIFRLAEQYLIRAEARANQGNIEGAKDDINLIRKRAGLTNTAANDKASMLLAIEKERQVELFCEWGNRWFDLQRTGRADAVLSLVKPNWNHNAILYPIPQTEITRNQALVQNPGY